jgi:hypothetical protein
LRLTAVISSRQNQQDYSNLFDFIYSQKVVESKDGFIGEYQDQAFGIFYVNGNSSSLKKIKSQFLGGNNYVTGLGKSPFAGEGGQEGHGSRGCSGNSLAALA